MRWACLGSIGLAAALLAQTAATVAPRTWDEEALREWATPVAGLNVRPGHFSVADYERSPIDNLRTYPVYYPGREPAGYWEMIQSVGPKPLVAPGEVSTDADWVRIGARVFAEYDVPMFRVIGDGATGLARRLETFSSRDVKPRADGTLPDLRWVPTSRGVALSLANCASCHVRALPDGTLVPGAPVNEAASPLGVFGIARWGSSTIELAGDSPPVMLWRSFGVPWVENDIHDAIKIMPGPQFGQLFGAAAAIGLFPRWNGSPYYPTKIPDLIGFKDRKYIDHTATHQHRSIGDLMRYAALVTYSDTSDFGPHRMLTDAQRRIPLHAPDEVLYALSRYIYSLEPPRNPNASDARGPAGQRVFQREGCAGCHTPPLYTNNRLTIARGFTPSDNPPGLDVMRVSVGTDPGLALKTRKGTGYYKVPSLKGVWYRGRYLHDGSVTTLEEMFNPARLQDDFVPSGFRPVGSQTHAVPGHEFGLRLNDAEKGELIAFLRGL